MNLNLSRKLCKGDQVANFFRINNLRFAHICLTFQSLAVTLCTTGFNIQELNILPTESIIVL